MTFRFVPRRLPRNADSKDALHMSASAFGTPDITLIGAGVINGTLGTLLKTLEPSRTVAMLETLEDCGPESSSSWNNAGTKESPRTREVGKDAAASLRDSSTER